MLYLIIKVVITTAIVVLASELAKSNTLIAALIVSLPIISILTLTWVYIDTHDLDKVAKLSLEIFWLVLPSMIFFLVLPVLIQTRMGYYLGLIFSIAILIIVYLIFTLALEKLDIFRPN